MSGNECVFCNLTQFRAADVCIENAYCLYASTRDPRDPPDVLPGCGVIIPIAHRRSPFEFTPQEWEATHDLLVRAKAAQDERLAPDGYTLIWNCFSEVGEPMHHAHLHVIPRFDDEPLAEMGGRSAIKVPENRRPDPSRRGNGRARAFGPPMLSPRPSQPHSEIPPEEVVASECRERNTRAQCCGVFRFEEALPPAFFSRSH
jgi:histidine triad (HIT) family protein